MDQVLVVLGQIAGVMDAQKGIIGIVVGFIFMAAKAISTEKAPPVIAQIQKIFDFIAKMLAGAGIIMQKAADFLAEAVKSDGMLGKK